MTLQEGVSAYSGCTDSTISRENPITNYGSDDYLWVHEYVDAG